VEVPILARIAGVLVVLPGVTAVIAAHRRATRRVRLFAVPCRIANGQVEKNIVFVARRVIRGAIAAAKF